MNPKSAHQDVQSISDRVDQKLSALEMQLQALNAKKAQIQDPAAALVIEKDINTLHVIKAKLIKSQKLAWQAHSLQSENTTEPDAPYKMLGLALIVLSIIGFLALALTLL